MESLLQLIIEPVLAFGLDLPTVRIRLTKKKNR